MLSVPPHLTLYLAGAAAGLAAGVQAVVRVSVQSMSAFVSGRSARIMNTAYTRDGKKLGYGSNGYGEGWPILFSRLLATTDRETWLFFPPLVLDGNPVANFPIYSITAEDLA